MRIAELSRLLGDQSFFAGDRPTLADMIIGSHLDFFAMTPEWDGLREGWKNLVTWLQRLELCPNFQATTWENVARKAAA